MKHEHCYYYALTIDCYPTFPTHISDFLNALLPPTSNNLQKQTQPCVKFRVIKFRTQTDIFLWCIYDDTAAANK